MLQERFSSDTHRPAGPKLPDWVPDAVARYLAHTELACSIRSIAREAGTHPSTVMRQVRKIETQREDPLADAALSALARAFTAPDADATQADLADTAELARAARSLLPRLCETGSILVVADTVGTAAIVRGDGMDGTLVASVPRPVASAMALLGWIACSATGRVSRYRITGAGRRAAGLGPSGATAGDGGTHGPGLAEAAAPLIADPASGPARRGRYGAPESPLVALARRRDKDGKPFLHPALVQAGERLREDFELAQAGPHGAPVGAPAPADRKAGAHAVGTGPAAARDRVARALAELGPGLGDVALRCCCHLEGLETAERRMGWSARSGKIVLRIALQRLCRHYAAQSGEDRMIG